VNRKRADVLSGGFGKIHGNRRLSPGIGSLSWSYDVLQSTNLEDY
jgi:hypothetical protein